MIKEINENESRYILTSPSVVLSKIKLNGVDISKYLSNETKISWYDVQASNANNTNADGSLVLNIICTLWKFDLVTRPLTEDELVLFYKEIIKEPIIGVSFLNPFTKEWDYAVCYRSGCDVKAAYPVETEDGLVEMYAPVSITLTEW